MVQENNVYVYDGTVVPKTVTNVVVKCGMKKIQDKAFFHCRDLKSIHIPDTTGLTEIGVGSFMGCTNLVSIELPSSIERIDDAAFYHCSSLKSVLFHSEITESDYSIPSNAPPQLTRIGQSAFFGCTNLVSINLPPSINDIGEHAFHECTNLVSIKIPSSMNKINIGTFSLCQSLTSIILPLSINEIDDCGFDDCSSLRSIIIQKSHDTQNSDLILNESESLPSIELSSLKIIGDFAFSGCSSIESLHLPSQMEFIGCGAFSDCTSLRSIILPSSVGFMKHSLTCSNKVFDNCCSIKKIMIQSSIHNIDPEVVLFLLDDIIKKNPDLAQTPCTADSCLPLHLFIMFGYFESRQNRLKTLIQTIPESLISCDPVYNMYPFQLAACTPLFKKEIKVGSITSFIIRKEKEQIETIYLLLREEPGVAKKMISTQIPNLNHV